MSNPSSFCNVIFIPLVEFRALLIRFLTAPVRLPAALAGFRFVLVCSRHGWTPLFQIKIKRRDSAMFAMESRFWLVRCAALVWWHAAPPSAADSKRHPGNQQLQTCVCCLASFTFWLVR
jgi:hypothetical protein